LRRDAEKFDRILLIAEALPAIREQVRRDMADIVSTGLSRRQVLACAVRLLDIGFFRIGGDEYAEQNGSFGLATIRREHVHIERGGPDGDDHVVFSYRAKSGKHRTQSVADPDAVRIVARLLERDDPQQDLLAWYDDEHGAWVDVHSSDVNAYLAELSPDVPLTAKDFRTWSATVLAAVALAVSTSVGSSPTASKRAVSRCYQEVSAYLGNTPAVCRASYVHPRVVELYQGGVTIAAELTGIGDGTAAGRPSTQGPVEQAVLTMLRDPQAARRCGRARSARRLTA
jgi:DNA topoisomerase-1